MFSALGQVITSPGESAYVFNEEFTIKVWIHLTNIDDVRSILEKKGTESPHLISLLAES